MSQQIISSADSLAVGTPKINQNFSELYGLLNEENRTLSVFALENVATSMGVPQILANLTGVGNVNSIQFAFYGTASLTDTLIRITVDGLTVVTVPIGIFFLTYGNSGVADGSNTWLTDNISVTECRSGYYGAFRRLFIPYNQNCRIECIPVGGYATVYSQVQYYSGAIPSFLTGTRRKSFGMSYAPLVSVSAYSAFQMLNVTGRGSIDSVQLAFLQAGSNPPGFLEGNPTFVIDGASVAYGGTEDFFGSQFYGESMLRRVTNAWGIPVNNLDNMSRTSTNVAGFRFFDRDRISFNASASLTAYNGQAGQTTTAGPTQMSSLVTYYLDSAPTPPSYSALATSLRGLSPSLLLIAGEGTTQNGGSASVPGDGTSASSNVSQWLDLSGFGYHATQSVTGSQPRLVSAGVNGKPGVKFDVTDDAMITSLVPRYAGNGYTIICVEMPGVASGEHRTVSSLTATVTATVAAIATLHRSDANKFYLGTHVATAAGISTSPHIWSFSAPPSGNIQVHIDGISIADATVAAADWGVLTLGALSWDGGSAETGDTTIRILGVFPYAQRSVATAVMAADSGIILS